MGTVPYGTGIQVRGSLLKAFLYCFNRWIVVIDGEENTLKWWAGAFFSLPPGRHTVSMYIRCMFLKYGRATVEVDVPPNGVATLNYHVFPILFMPGMIRVSPATCRVRNRASQGGDPPVGTELLATAKFLHYAFWCVLSWTVYWCIWVSYISALAWADFHAWNEATKQAIIVPIFAPMMFCGMIIAFVMMVRTYRRTKPYLVAMPGMEWVPPIKSARRWLGIGTICFIPTMGFSGFFWYLQLARVTCLVGSQCGSEALGTKAHQAVRKWWILLIQTGVLILVIVPVVTEGNPILGILALMLAAYPVVCCLQLMGVLAQAIKVLNEAAQLEKVPVPRHDNDGA